MKMKKIALALGFLASTSAIAEEARVVSVEPVYRERTQYEQVVTTETVCRDYMVASNDGWIERGTSGVFGSTEGLIGTAIGVAIGEHIGGGSGNDAAKVIGGIVGNRVGNNVARNRAGQMVCEDVERVNSVPRTHSYLDHYRVRVLIDSNEYVVTRNFEPSVGSVIPVNISVR